MRRSLRNLCFAIALAVTAGSVILPGPAEASVAYESPYTFEQTFGTALRLLRVDLGCAITEKDVENGYLLFDYTSPESGSRVHHGSVEIVRGKPGAHVSVQLPTLPRYHEQMIVDALVKKLQREHGEPVAPAPPPPPPPPSSDAGVEAP